MNPGCRMIEQRWRRFRNTGCSFFPAFLNVEPVNNFFWTIVFGISNLAGVDPAGL